MLSLSPAKILVVLIVALIVLGPEKLPQVARQLGAAWGDLRRLRTRLESEVRDVFPDLPPTHEVAQAVRSPLLFLDRLADEHERTTATAGQVTEDRREGNASPPGPGSARGTPGTGATGDAVTVPDSAAPGMGRPALDAASTVVADDPSMN